MDLRKLAYKCNAEFLRLRAVKIEPKFNMLILEDGTEVKYDILSVNIGSRTLGTQTVPGVWDHSLTTRPVNCKKIFFVIFFKHEFIVFFYSSTHSENRNPGERANRTEGEPQHSYSWGIHNIIHFYLNTFANAI